MSMEASMDMKSVLEPEKEALSFSTELFRDVATPFQSTETSLVKNNINDDTRTGNDVVSPGKSSGINIMVAVFVLIIAVIIGFVLVFMMGSWFINLTLLSLLHKFW